MTREKAIKIVKEFINGTCLHLVDQEALETLIPELKESEDERIRRELMEFVNWAASRGSVRNDWLIKKCPEKWVAYLEKMKENPKSADSILSDCVSDVKWADTIITRVIVALSDDVDYNMDEPCKYRREINDLKKLREVLCGQKEQKPAESISQPTVQGKGVYKICPRCKERMIRDDSMVYTSMPPQYRYECPKCGESECDTFMYDNPEMEEQKPAENGVDVIKTSALLAADRLASAEMTGRLKERSEILDNPTKYGLQKPAKWSEEDEKTFWGLTAYIPNEELERLGITRDDILKKLQSLRLQPIQLKEAYKEGFQTARYVTALAFMNYCDKIRPNGKMCLSSDECEEIEKAFLVGDWEKIERYFHKYYWKPSEHQMTILKAVKEYIGVGSGYWGEALGSLIEDLEKLM